MEVRIFRRSHGGFSLVELLVAMAVLALLMVLIGQIFTSATAVTGARNKRMDTDGQARAVFGRMAVDIGQMVRRPDVDYFLKSRSADASGVDNFQRGNDQMAFYSQVPGYFTGSESERSPAAVVAWRVNAGEGSASFNQLQRLGRRLRWSGNESLEFSGPSGPLVSAVAANRLSSKWPESTSPTAADSGYEEAGPEVFRMEYYYVLRGQTAQGTAYPSRFSDTPWDARIPGRASVDGLRDVAAIAVVIAVADPKSRSLVTDAQITALAASMNDFDAVAMPEPGDLEAQWQAAIDDPANGIPRAAASAMRTYRRTFALPNP